MGMIKLRLNLPKLAELMESRGIRSQAELARRSGWGLRRLNWVIQDTRRGRFPSFTLNKLAALCAALRVDVCDLLEQVSAVDSGGLLDARNTDQLPLPIPNGTGVAHYQHLPLSTSQPGAVSYDRNSHV